MRGDQIVEERQWWSGVEVVSHINHTQIARVRATLGLSAAPLRSPLAAVKGGRRLPVAMIRAERRWRTRELGGRWIGEPRRVLDR